MRQPSTVPLQNDVSIEVGPASQKRPFDFPAAFAEAETSYEQVVAIIDWAERSPDDAWEWAFNELTGDLRDEALDGLIYRISTLDLEWAWERTLSLTPSTHRVKLLAHCLAVQAETDQAKTKERLLSISPGIERDYLLSSVVEPLEQPADALALILELSTMPLDYKQGSSILHYDLKGSRTMASPGPSNSATRVADDLVTRLGEENPREALAWIGRLGLKSIHTSKLIQRWHEQSPEQAQAWIDQAPPEISHMIPHEE